MLEVQLRSPQASADYNSQPKILIAPEDSAPAQLHRRSWLGKHGVKLEQQALVLLH